MSEHERMSGFGCVLTVPVGDRVCMYGSRRKSRVLAVAAALALGAGAAVAAMSPATVLAAECPNEAVRVEQGSAALELPDCRAYELVSAPGVVPRFSGQVGGELAIEGARAASGGQRMAYSSYYPSVGSSQADGMLLARRTETGWTSESVMPPRSVSSITGCSATMFFSSELTSGVLADGGLQTSEPSCGHNEPALVSDEPAGWRNEAQVPYRDVLLRESFEGSPSYRLVNRTPSTVMPSDAQVQDASVDLSHVVFSEEAKLTEEAPASGESLYEWVAGSVHLVSVLPGGEGVAGSIADPTKNGEGSASGIYIGAAPYMHAVSDDGSRVFFTAEGKLFVRMHAEAEPHVGSLDAAECVASDEACTIQVDSSQVGGPGGAGTFFAASDDGSRVFFMDEASAKLTSTTVSGSEENLYEYEVATGALTDLTAVSEAEVVGVSGFGEAEGSGDSYLYFVAEGKLAAGAREGQANLYMVHNGKTPVFVATLDASLDKSDWNLETLAVRTSPDGRFLAFDSAREQQPVNFPSGYDNIDLETKRPDEEIYLYDTESRELSCVSCQPSGAEPSAGGAELLGPSGVASGAQAKPGYLQRNVLNDGTVFMQTAEPLVSGVKGGVSNVYEYKEGRPRLISTGTSSEGSYFAEANENGEDVFFATTQSLVAADRDEALSLYDARVNGGFPSRETELVKPPACEKEECRPPASEPPASQSVASATLSGPGNLLVSSQPPPGETKRTLTRAQELAKALAACHKQGARQKREACEARARSRYGAKAKTKNKDHHKSKRGGRR